MFIEPFRFNLALWQRALVREPLVLPPEAPLRLTIDPSYTSDLTSDCSGLLVSYKSQRDPDIGGVNVNVLDGSCGRFKGIKLAEEIVRLASLWNPQRIRIEKQGPGAYDLLADTILLLAKESGITIHDLASFIPDNQNRAKANRIRRIEKDLLVSEPPCLRIYSKAFFDILIGQAEKFAFESNTNLEREDAALDCLALTSFRGEL